MSSSFKGFSNFRYNLHFDHFVDRLVIKKVFFVLHMYRTKNTMQCIVMHCNAMRSACYDPPRAHVALRLRLEFSISVCRLQFLDLILSVPFCFDFSLSRSPHCFSWPV